MLRDVKTDNKPLTEKEVREFFSKVGLNVPAPYLEFLSHHNGGRPIPKIFPIEGLPLNPDGAIQVFFGIDDTVSAVDLKNVLMDLPATVPMGIIPIACTDGGDYICFDLRRDGFPVVYWDRRQFWGNEVWSESYLFPVAPNFEKFLECLCDDTV